MTIYVVVGIVGQQGEGYVEELFMKREDAEKYVSEKQHELYPLQVIEWEVK